ncbi:MAG: hypothetical protein HY054_02075 [Proteobacteria bacterium]|nr:hypothetical protein [Pseudomonadota bacterium]
MRTAANLRAARLHWPEAATLGEAMDLKGFVDRAKEAANAAAQKAQAAANAISAAAATPALETPPPEPAPVEGKAVEASNLALTEQVPPPIAAEAATAGPPAAPTKSFGALANDKLNELSAAGAQKVQELVLSFQQALPAIKSAGYEMTEFEVELGVTPKLIPHFRHAAKSVEDVDAARVMLKDNKLGMMILVALLKAGDVHRQIKVAGFAFTHIEIELGLIPSVRLQYKNDLAG